jgi:hypothetical protein
LNLSRQGIWHFKSKLELVEKSAQGFSGLEKLLTLRAVTQVLFDQYCRSDVQFIIDIGIDEVVAFLAIHRWPSSFRSDKMR